MPKANTRHHAEWLSLIEVSGPFLSLPVLLRVFPQGLDADDPDHTRDLRMAFEEWQDNQLGPRPRAEVHKAWFDFVLRETLELPDEVVATGQDIPQSLKATVSEHGETLRPDIVIQDPESKKPRLLIQTYPLAQGLEKPVSDKRWKASPDTRMTELLHSTDVRLGLVTNGEQWMLVDAPRGETSGYASWYASLWLEERLTLRAFRSLLGTPRFFAVGDDETLEAMLAESAENQQEVTDQLGYQVRRAVEVLVQTIDRADQDRGRALLADVPEAVLYEAALTVMMRLVFLFCAEERDLLLLGDPTYDEHYAVSTLADQLQVIADQHGEEVLERRRDAWCRLLSTFRAVYGGVHHERMSLLAYAGSLFDPDRFPLLEGRQSGTSWRDTQASPLPVDNRTVLHLLRSLQYLEMQLPGGGPAESRRLSFRALDIEQIGHVYEGLLDHTATRATEPIVGLQGTKNKEPEVPLPELERLRERGEDDLVDFLKKETGRSKSALGKALESTLEGDAVGRLLAACGSDDALCERMRPFAGLLRNDSFGHPVVIGEGSVYVAAGTDRRSSGTHYTPRSLTEPIVQYTLEPLVYVGPAEGKPKEEWQLKPPEELLDLKICDMACGSGAFLVQACRYMAERVVEAWEDAESQHPDGPGITPFGKPSSGEPGDAIIPKDTDERMAFARRLVAQRCLYGVDINPLAVEMAKLSLWLLTLAHDKPFTFLNHAIRPGDSLVGIRDIKQIEAFNLDGTGGQNRVILQFLPERIKRAVELRRKIEERPAELPEDVAAQEELMRQVEEETLRLNWAADMLVSADFRGTTAKEREAALTQASLDVAQWFEERDTEFLARKAHDALDGQVTFHWPLEFPEVMVERGGFDAFVCNPPFMGGQKITQSLGASYREYLVHRLANRARGSADLCAYFVLRAAVLLRLGGQFGLVTSDIIAQGVSREVALEQIVRDGYTITRAVPSRNWPGLASVQYTLLWVRRGAWHSGAVLDDRPVPQISVLLTSGGQVEGRPESLHSNDGRSFQGTIVLGMGFILEPGVAEDLLRRTPQAKDVVFPYLMGKDINAHPEHEPSRWVIDFSDWPLDRRGSASGCEGPVAADYPECLRTVEALVKPEREKSNRKARRERWWQFAERATGLYAALGDRCRCLAIARAATKYVEFALVPTGAVYADSLTVIALDDFESFAVLSSSFQKAWARRYASYNLSLLRYTPSECFGTFPFPSPAPPSASIGEAYHEYRRRVMLDRWEGITKTYNRLHSPQETAEDIRRLRELHVQMDHAVAAAYGWTDLNLGHGFHETKQGTRYTISEEARREVLDRLLQLNHERYAEEVAQGLHDKKKPKRKAKKKPAKKKPSDGPSQPTLLD